MRFKLLDRITELQPGKSITAVKSLALGEDYLADHFPLFPVMPGVFMLEAMSQASAWLIRVSENFKHSIVVLREARNVKYADFVSPGQTLTVQAEIIGETESETKLKVQGMVDGKVNVSARLVMARYNVSEVNVGAGKAARDSLDAHVIRDMRNNFTALFRPLRSSADPSINGHQTSTETAPQASHAG